MIGTSVGELVGSCVGATVGASVGDGVAASGTTTYSDGLLVGGGVGGIGQTFNETLKYLRMFDAKGKTLYPSGQGKCSADENSLIVDFDSGGL